MDMNGELAKVTYTPYISSTHIMLNHPHPPRLSFLHRYDFLTFGVVSGLVFQKTFLPPDLDAVTKERLIDTTFVGFAARPIGGIISGHFGDKVSSILSSYHSCFEVRKSVPQPFLERVTKRCLVSTIIVVETIITYHDGALQFGRKVVLVVTLMIMGLSTFALGLIPDYSHIGNWSYGLVLFFRIMQVSI